MQDVTRKRIMRKLESLPEEQLYQVLDYIEFMEAKYAAIAARKPDRFQQFAERVEDQMRVRALAPRAVKGTMKLMSTASRMLEGVRDLGRDLWTPSGPSSGPGDGRDAGSAPGAAGNGGESAPLRPAAPSSGAGGSPGVEDVDAAGGATGPAGPEEDGGR